WRSRPSATRSGTPTRAGTTLRTAVPGRPRPAPAAEPGSGRHRGTRPQHGGATRARARGWGAPAGQERPRPGYGRAGPARAVLPGAGWRAAQLVGEPGEPVFEAEPPLAPSRAVL